MSNREQTAFDKRKTAAEQSAPLRFVAFIGGSIKDGEQHFKFAGTCGFPFFGAFIRDCLDETEHAMSQAHAFKAIELAILAREQANTIQ
jgi:hypothetical protein